MKISIAQINPSMGDFSYNLQLIKSYIQKAQDVDIIVFPELCISGYNPQDLVLRNDFIEKSQDSICKLIHFSKDHKAAFVVGSISKENSGIYNSAYLIHNGKILLKHNKISLPNYGVFDEKRIFDSGNKFESVEFLGQNITLVVCEDFWDTNNYEQIKNTNPDIIISINASPYSKTKIKQRVEKAEKISTSLKCRFIYANQVGLQDSVIYDGNSFAMNESGLIIDHLKPFKEQILLLGTNYNSSNISPVRDIYEEIYSALVFSLKEYCKKNNIKSVTIGFSSGIDSTLSSIIAFDALGLVNVELIALPTKYNSKETHDDASDFEKYNNISLKKITIQKLYEDFLESLNFEKEDNITCQNLQSRIRGIILMAISNKNNSLLLSTGNKSELAVGYATIYGDMNGGYNLLKDLYKGEVYELAKWRNKNIPHDSKHKISKPIPENIIIKEPTAELKLNQKDSDTLPNYDILDDILYNYIDLLKSRDYIINLGYNPEIVDQVLNLIRISQFKRYQSTMGPKISDMSFDLDWRYPIINKFI
jgi:NAD+ synthetase